MWRVLHKPVSLVVGTEMGPAALSRRDAWAPTVLQTWSMPVLMVGGALDASLQESPFITHYRGRLVSVLMSISHTLIKINQLRAMEQHLLYFAFTSAGIDRRVRDTPAGILPGDAMGTKPLRTT